MSGSEAQPHTDAEASLGTGALIRRMLGLAWEYRLSCVRVLAIQLILLVLGMLGLGLMGLGVDYIRYELSIARAVPSPLAVVATDGGARGATRQQRDCCEFAAAG